MERTTTRTDDMAYEKQVILMDGDKIFKFILEYSLKK